MLCAIGAGFSLAAQTPAPPAKVYGKLFHDVQMAPLYPDQKTFPDAVPKKAPAAIVADYQKATGTPGVRFALDLFVAENFELPKEPQLNYTRQETDVLKYARNCWTALRREPEKAVEGSSLLPLPYPYIVPGGHWRELNYATAYFALLGLQESGQPDMIENVVKDFASMADSFGYIPAGNRSYLLGRSGPPYFALMVELLAAVKGDNAYTTYLPELEKEYNYWMEDAAGCKPGQAARHVVRMPDGALLNRYWDDNNTPRTEHYRDDITAAQKAGNNKMTFYQQLNAASTSGWEPAGRWRMEAKNNAAIEVLAVVPVDLNCLLYKLERVIARARLLQGQDSVATVFNKKAEARAYAIDKYCWNKQLNFYTDYDFRLRKPLNLVTPAGIYPFCVYEAKPDYMSLLARRVAVVLKTTLLKGGGIQSSGNITGLDGDAPYGMAALQWMTIYGMDRCGQKELARDIALRWMKLNAEVFKRSGKLLERYNVADAASDANNGAAAGTTGFDATNGVLLKLASLYGMPGDSKP